MSDKKGLSEQAVLASRRKNGANKWYIRPKRKVFHIIIEMIREPMVIMLMAACAAYFILNQPIEGWMMVVSILFVALIELVQELRSERALEALRKFTQAKSKVYRDGVAVWVDSEELVVGDWVVLQEGERVPADGVLVEQHDMTVDESVLTGESMPVDKKEAAAPLFQGTSLVTGAGIMEITAVGLLTSLGKLGKFIESIEKTPTPLQLQIDRFVRQMGWIGFGAFLLTFAINYQLSGSLLAAFLFSLTLAMALIPEEIPVAFTTFMSLGAYRMTKKQILAKQPKTVESLGAATVICLDKTGTITENKMKVAALVDISGRNQVLEYAFLASEPAPFDAMEKAIHSAWEDQKKSIFDSFLLVKEYALGGQPPMMTHVYEHEHQCWVAAKGAVERIIRVSGLNNDEAADILKRTSELAAKGFRVLGVASSTCTKGDFPSEQDDFKWLFEGLIAFYDPPKAGIQKVFKQLYAAGIQVKMITGDHPATALHIATESGLEHNGVVVTGAELEKLEGAKLIQTVQNTQVFARVFPEVKLKIVEALKAGGAVVAMTGDGVNDGPALKSAQIGVAMGRSGTEIAKGAASLVLLDDDLKRLVTAVKMGRRIYNNLRKAIRYVISIHLPIVTVVLAPLLLGWPFVHILWPVHVIFMELVMDPTCAVAFENEPAEANVLKKAPRARDAALFSWPELWISILQGLVISVGVLGMYQLAVHQGMGETKVRSYVFVTMIFSNIFLTYANRSFDYTIARTIFYKNNIIWWVTGISLLMTALILYVPQLNRLFMVENMGLKELGICAGTALVSVGWFEVYKAFKATRAR